jgi:hypothetical protein
MNNTNEERIMIDENTNFIALSMIQGKIPLQSILQYKERWNWNLLSRYQPFNIIEMAYIEDCVNFKELFKEHPFDVLIARKYTDYLDWDHISNNCDMTVDDMIEFKDYINWEYGRPNQNVFLHGLSGQIRSLANKLDWHYFEDKPLKYDLFFLKDFKEEIPWWKVQYTKRWNRQFVYQFADVLPWYMIVRAHPELMTEEAFVIAARYLLIDADTSTGEANGIYALINNYNDEVVINCMEYIDGFTHLGIKAFAGLPYVTELLARVSMNDDEYLLDRVSQTLDDILVHNYRLDETFLPVIEEVIKIALHVDELYEGKELFSIETSLLRYAYNLSPNKKIVDFIKRVTGKNIYTDPTKCISVDEYVGFAQRYPDLAFSEGYPNNIDTFVDIIAEYGTAEAKQRLIDVINTHELFEGIPDKDKADAIDKLEGVYKEPEDKHKPIIPEPPKEEGEVDESNDNEQ